MSGYRSTRMPWRRSKRRGDSTRAGALLSQGNRIQQSSVAWDKAKQRAGIEDFRFHDLRHTWASWHVQSGTSLPELMELGGWNTYEMVLRYAHLAPEKLSIVAGRIERQASKLLDGVLHEEKVAKNATFSRRSVN